MSELNAEEMALLQQNFLETQKIVLLLIEETKKPRTAYWQKDYLQAFSLLDQELVNRMKELG
ncbi:MAG: hypothetical protein AAF518_27895 [Spirochaetota bacterium]